MLKLNETSLSISLKVNIGRGLNNIKYIDTDKKI